MNALPEEIRQRNLDRCKFCRDEILWATIRSADPTRTGKTVQLDPTPAVGGNVAVSVDDVGMLIARGVKPVGTVEAYVLHSTVCTAREDERLPSSTHGLDHDEQRAARLKALQMRMPFGKHEGETLEEIDRHDRRYIKWAAENLEFRNAELGKAVRLIAGLE